MVYKNKEADTLSNFALKKLTMVYKKNVELDTLSNSSSLRSRNSLYELSRKMFQDLKWSTM